MTELRNLTYEEIEKLAGRKGVRRIAVENFLSSMGGQSKSDAYGNLGLDTMLYRWNAATVTAIQSGINLAAKAAPKQTQQLTLEGVK
jgi:hypothetical protein